VPQKPAAAGLFPGGDLWHNQNGMNLTPDNARQAAPGHRRKTGSIELLCGCMFAGKTERLLRRLKAAGDRRVRAFKHRRDARYAEAEIVSHGGVQYPAVVVDRADEILEHVDGTEDLIAIDEGHFFDPALPTVCRDLADRGLEVVITALDPDSWGKPFAVIETLKTVADRVVKIATVCAQCGKMADRTQRTEPIVNGNIIGGPEAFEPRCAACWHPPPEEHIA
jgi:thymidine kinase